MGVLSANHEILFVLIVVRRYPRNTQTRVGTWNDFVNVEPGTANTSRKIGVTSGRMTAIVVLLIIL